MNYQESIAYLESLSSFGIKPGLTRINAMLDKLDHPEKAYKVIHVTGTNGKGSVVAMITSVLENAQLRIGRYVSPHLVDYTERIYLGSRDISRDDFAKACTIVKEAADKIIAEGIEAPTEFEILTAMAFWYFKEMKADYAVIEVGMGGTYDSTNVVLPVVSVITNVAMDHMAYLGNTLQEIARQKAGIIKENVPIVTAAQHVALKEIKKVAHDKKAKLYFYGRDFEIDSRSKFQHGQVVVVKRKDMPKELENSLLFVPFVGAHQAVNASVATMALSVIMKQDHRVNENDLREGLARAVWKGRFEIYTVKGKTVVLDGAHNPAGAEALKEALEEQYPEKRRVFVFTSLEDKDTETVIQLLMRKDDVVYACEAPTPRTRKPEEIGSLIEAQNLKVDFHVAGNVKEALDGAIESATENDVVIVCGSLYIIGEAMEEVHRLEGAN